MSFGMMEAVLGFLRRQIGLRTDTADAAGSVHAKIKDTKDYLVNTINPKVFPWKDTDAYAAKVTVTNSTYVTVVSVSGTAGYLTGVTAWPRGNVYSTAKIRVTIDGVQKFTDYQIAEQADNTSGPDYKFVNSIPMFLRYKTSLLVEAAGSDDTYSTDCDVLATYMTD